MALQIKSVRVALATGGATQDIRIAGMTELPLLAMFELVRATAANEHAAHGQISRGYFDGTRSKCCGVAVRDAVGSSDTYAFLSANFAGMSLVPTSGGVDCGFSGNSFLADAGSGAGVRIDLDNLPASGYYMIVTLWGGSDIAEAYVNHHDDLGTGTSAVDITAMGSQADTVFVNTIGRNSVPSDTSSVSHAIYSGGVWDRIDAQQRFNAYSSRDGRGTIDSTNYSNSSNVTGQAFYIDVRWLGSISSHANGFSITPSDDAGSDIIIYAAIRWATYPDVEVVGSQLPASAIDWAESGFSFEPEWGMSSFTGTDEFNTNDQSGGDFGISIHTYEVGQVLSAGFSDTDGATSAVTSSFATDDFYIGQADDGSGAASQGALQSIDADGWTIDLGGGSHDSVERVGWSIAIRAIAAAGGTEYFQSVAGLLSPSGSIAKSTRKLFSGSFAPVGFITKMTNKNTAGSITFFGEVSVVTVFTQAIAGSLSPVGAITKRTFKRIAGSLAPVGVIAKRTFKRITGSLSPTGTVNKLTTKDIDGSLTPIGNLTSASVFLQSVAGSLSFSGALDTLKGIVTFLLEQFNDVVMNVTGPQIDDGLLAHYRTNGATSDMINDAEFQYLVARGIAPSTLGDMWRTYLFSKGYSGNVTEMKRDWWKDDAPL